MMRVQVDAAALRSAVRFVGSAVARTGMPAVALESSDNGLAVTASDGRAIRRSVVTDADMETAGQVVVPHPLLAAITGKASGRLVLHDGDGRLVVQTGRTRFELPLMDPDVLPRVDLPETFEHRVGAAEWANWQRRIVPFVGRDHTRPGLTQIVVDDGIVFGSDSYRLGMLPTGLPDMRLPVEVIHGDDADIHVDGSLVFVRSGDNVVGSPLVGDSPPDYRQIVPQEWGIELQLDAGELAGLVDEALALAHKKSCLVLSFEGREVRTRIAEQDGVAEGRMAMSGIVDPLTIGFGPARLADALKVFDGEITVGLISPLRPALLSDGDVRHLLMPMRVPA